MPPAGPAPIVSRLELGLAAVLGLLSVAGLALPSSGLSAGHGDSGAFAFVIGAALAPIAVALAAAGFAAGRGMRPAWLYQCLPLGVVAALAGFLAWAK